MFATISLAIAQFFRAMTMFFSGVEQGASAFNNIMGVANDASGSMADVAAVERKVARFKALAVANAEAAALGMTLDADLNTAVKSSKSAKPVAVSA